MYYTIYKEFFEFPLLILFDKDVKDISIWESNWEEKDNYFADPHSILVGLGTASTGHMIDDPMLIFVSETITLGRETKLNLKFEDFDTLLFKGTIQLGKSRALCINEESNTIEFNESAVELKIWGNEDKYLRRDLYIEIESI